MSTASEVNLAAVTGLHQSFWDDVLFDSHFDDFLSVLRLCRLSLAYNLIITYFV